ncbi:MAG: aminoglycoside phosphotransferase family protein [Alphaproteobacteria bacterium]|nr:aminoglycoside phosphotransferase family protein [Candidatus Jidaibacter sp.]
MFIQKKIAPANVVLKLPPAGYDEVQQKEIIQHFNGNGTIRLLNSDGANMLLERLCPGRHVIELTKAERDDEATRIFCQIVRQLHSAKGSIGNFKPIAELALAFDRYLDTDDKTISTQEVQQANELYLSLIDSQAMPVLLHGDLHHDNILNDDVRGWVSIDPKGYVAEPM